MMEILLAIATLNAIKLMIMKRRHKLKAGISIITFTTYVVNIKMKNCHYSLAFLEAINE